MPTWHFLIIFEEQFELKGLVIFELLLRTYVRPRQIAAAKSETPSKSWLF
jgi:hypothetical protein